MTDTTTAAPAPQHTDAEEAMLQQLYADLKPEAQIAYLNYFLARTPADLQQDMADLIKADMAPPEEVPPGARSAPPSLSEVGQLAALRFAAEGAATKFDEVRSEFAASPDTVQPQPAPPA
jgi:hypothetical protein